MWDSVSLTEITERIAEVEQQRALCALNEMGAARQSIITCEDVPEQARMFDVNIVSNDEAKTVELGFGSHAHESDGRIVVEEINLIVAKIRAPMHPVATGSSQDGQHQRYSCR